MPTLDQLTQDRIKSAERAGIETAALVRTLQEAGYSIVMDWVSGNIDIDENKIKYTARNLSKVQGLYRVLADFQRKYQGTMLGAILEWTGKIIGLNDDYFNSFTSPAESVAETARRLALERWGYKTATNEIIAGGYFETLFSNQEIARKVARLVNQAITQGMSLKDFQRMFKSVFVGKFGEGMLERHWKTNSFDLFQRIDRTANLVYADKLGLNYAIDSHTIIETSRPWCIAHANGVYSRKEIAKWKTENTAAASPYYDPFVDCGGVRCRGHWSWISDGVAQHLRPELKVK